MSLAARKERRGGARPNSGPKVQTLSAHQVRLMLNVAQQYAKKQKKTIDMILCGFIYDENLKPADRMAAIKCWKEYTMAKLVEGGEADTELGPTMYLPDERPDQGKVVPFERLDSAPR